MSDDNWYAYCPVCDEYLYSNKNGGIAQAQAEKHTKETEHEVLLGQNITREDVFDE